MEKEKKKKEKEKGKGRKKILWIVLIAVLVYVVSVFVFSPLLSEKEKKVEYTKFLEEVEKGEVEEITINTGTGKVFYKMEGKDCYTNYPYTEDFIENMLLAKVDVKYKSSFNIMNYISPISSICVILIMFFIGRSLIKEFSKEIETAGVIDTSARNTSFADIAGMDEIKEDMKSLAELVKNKEFRKRGITIPKGVLLDGPPGNGKTLLARAFAGECGLGFLALNASDFESKYVGVSSEKINRVFEEAKKIAPCVIFIDEIDAIGSKRMAARSGAEKEFNSILTTLLGRMDGFTQSDDIIVMAATNRAADLDEALVRPGRFDRKFTIGYPDKKTRFELFKLYTKKAELADDVNFNSLVSQTYGCSSADVKAIVNEAIINSVVNKRDAVTDEDFSNAIVRMTLNGVQKKSDKWEGKTKNIVAYHEAGHAVVAHMLGKTVTNISIIPTTASAGGYTLLGEEEEEITSISDYRNRIRILYGGRAAETMLAEDVKNISTGASNDIKEATDLASFMVNFVDGVNYSAFGNHGTKIVAEKTKKELEIIWEETLSLIEENWNMVTKVAEELKIKEKLTGEEFENLLSLI